LELKPLLHGVARVGDPRAVVAEQVADIVAAGVELPRLALRDPKQPATPMAVAVRLGSEELKPRVRTGVLDVFAAGADGSTHVADELVVVLLEEQIRLVAAEP
jgi:hypothetical protein